MNKLNQVIFEGNVEWAEEKKMQDGGCLLAFCVVHSRNIRLADGGKSKERTYIDCEWRGETVKKMSGRCKEGQGVRIVGHLKQKNSVDECGRKCTPIILVAEHIDFMARPEKTEEAF